MSWRLPMAADVLSAIEIYLSLAYDGPPPLAVRGRLDALRGVDDEKFFAQVSFERSPAVEPTKYCLRLGNRFYPHMKLVIERAPDGVGALYRADTHDRHVQPRADAPEAAALAAMSQKNQELAQRIESAWEEQGMLTFKMYLKQDLARRRAGQAG